MNRTLLLGFGILFAFTFAVTPAQAATDWDVSGTYITQFTLGGSYNHDMILVQDESGNITGEGGGYPAGGSYSYEWNIIDGSVVNDAITLLVEYIGGPDAVGTIMNMTGIIHSNGTMDGVWDDNYGGTLREGTWATIQGVAVEDMDTDDDGVLNGDDYCPNSSADGLWTVGLGNNRLEVRNIAGDLMWVQNKVGKKGVASPVTVHGIDYTHGCNGHEIIELLDGVMNGHLKYGVTAGLVEEFHFDLMDGELDGIYLVDTVLVNSALVAGANSSVLVSGQEYRFDVSGTWTNRPGETVDAKFTTMDTWGTWTDAPAGGYHEDLIELQVNNAFVEWGDYSSAHAYSVAFTPAADASVNFRVFDGDVLTNTPLAWYSDNVGTLTVKVYAQI